MREPSDADGIFPWVARELSKLSKATIRKIEDAADPPAAIPEHSAYRAWLTGLRRSGNLIAQWAKANRVDLMKMSLVEALDASRGFRVKKKVEHGEIVYKFKSGWTIESLKGKKQLDCEGDFLSHCVYRYKDAVDRGRSVIYSLRDPDGVPYVTMEWQPWRRKENPPPQEGYRWDGTFTQIFGHQNSEIGSDDFGEFAEYVLAAGQDNEPPLTREEVPEVVRAIRAMVIEFIDKVKGGEPKGIYFAGGSFRGRDLIGAQLSHAQLAEADLSGANLNKADLSRARLDLADLSETNLSKANLNEARLDEAKLTRANLSGAFVQEAILRNADLREANLSGADLYEADLYEADLRGANLHGVNLYDAKLYNTNLRGVNLSDTQHLKSATLTGARYSKGTRWPSGFDPVAAGAVLVTESAP
jgi:hypothetical protein